MYAEHHGAPHGGIMPEVKPPHTRIATAPTHAPYLRMQSTAVFQTLASCLGAAAWMRSGCAGGRGSLLTPGEWRAYSAALESGSCSYRMALAALVSGDQVPPCFFLSFSLSSFLSFFLSVFLPSFLPFFLHFLLSFFIYLFLKIPDPTVAVAMGWRWEETHASRAASPAAKQRRVSAGVAGGVGGALNHP